LVSLGKVSIAVKTFGVCDFSRLAVTDWRLRRWRLWFLALMTATPSNSFILEAVFAQCGDIVLIYIIFRAKSFLQR